MVSRLPPNSWDSHIHIIDPERFPLDPDRDYTPKSATVADATRFQESRGVQHAVIVLPSVYGTDNSVLLDALRQFQGQYRGVAVVDPDAVSDSTLRELHAAGVRGVRVNCGSGGTDDEMVDAVRKNAAIARRHGWVLELWIPLRAFRALHPLIPDLRVPVVVEHYAHHRVGSMTEAGTNNTSDPYQSPGFREVIDLVQRKLLFVKLSAPYKTSSQAPLYEDMRATAEALIQAGPDMVVYGSDWPHTASKEGNAAAGGRLVPQEWRDVDDAALVEVLRGWLGSEDQVRRTFVDNPRRLWQWEEDS